MDLELVLSTPNPVLYCIRFRTSVVRRAGHGRENTEGLNDKQPHRHRCLVLKGTRLT